MVRLDWDIASNQQTRLYLLRLTSTRACFVCNWPPTRLVPVVEHIGCINMTSGALCIFELENVLPLY